MNKLVNKEIFMINKVFILGIIALCFMAIIACRESKKTVPENTENIIPVEDFIDILYDIHLTDAIILSKIIKFDEGNIDSLIYNSIFIKHEYSKDDFEKTLGYYIYYNLDSLNIIYSMVMDKLNVEKAEIIR